MLQHFLTRFFRDDSNPVFLFSISGATLLHHLNQIQPLQLFQNGHGLFIKDFYLDMNNTHLLLSFHKYNPFV